MKSIFNLIASLMALLTTSPLLAADGREASLFDELAQLISSAEFILIAVLVLLVSLLLPLGISFHNNRTHHF